jgi:3'(2'), 5'-bisphosphate nucleotidase
MKKELQIAIEAAIHGGAEIMKIYQNDFHVEVKDDNSPLTVADKNANDIINSYLVKTEHPIISEENKQTEYAIRKDWNSCWIVDPLDGTKEFVKRNGEFTVNIALIKKQKPVLGVIYVPDSKVLYYADVEKQTAFKCVLKSYKINFKELEQNSVTIRPNKIVNKIIKVVGSRSHMSKETEDYVNALKSDFENVEIVSKGSSLKFCMVAEGIADVYPRFAPTMEWDTAAGQAICEAVGLQVISKETNKPLLYNRENLLNSWFLVSK